MSTSTLAPAATPVTAAAPPSSRAHVLRSHRLADFPNLTGQEEEWRFTPLRRLRGLAAADLTADAGPGLTYEYAEAPPGVTIITADRETSGAGSVLTPFDRISALALARVDKVLRVEVARESVVDEPVTIQVLGPGADKFAFGHAIIEVGALAEVTVVLVQHGSATLADNIEVTIGDGAQLRLVTVADWTADTVQAQHLRLRLGRDARVTHSQITLGGDLVRQYTSVDYTGRGGDAQLNGVYFAGAEQHQEHRLLVDHSVADCRSNVSYRGALQGDGAHTVWVGDVLIEAAATGTDTYEVNRNLILSDGARADSVPNLEIETGEVIGAGHASTTGRFDDEQLFYLMARGITETEARRMVVRGFFAELIDTIDVPQLRERLIEAIDTRLAAAEQATVGEENR